MGLASPETDEERKLAEFHDRAYETGWNEAIDAAVEEILKTPGRIGFKQAASIVLALKDTDRPAHTQRPLQNAK